ncbi:dephospho-CoA kinase [Psychroserpens sp.]|jgi:dephospho-CoA kinase|uniref:dephospho-CoA kinase n=1 Tax=Psychroserpens sp. TaxID=2020870 RepID=UPI0039E2AAC6
MIVVGLTGGIGSGKTTVANFFKALDVPVYIADDEAKLLMTRSKVIKRQLIALFGDEAYIENELNKPFLASKIFSDKDYLKKMNAIIHPKVTSHFKRWLKKQNSIYVIKEAAIIFEHNKEAQYNFIITVTANLDARINRVIKRDNSSKSKIESIIKNQMSDKEKVEKSHFVITNDNLEDTQAQVLKTHQSILKQI